MEKETLRGRFEAVCEEYLRAFLRSLQLNKKIEKECYAKIFTYLCCVIIMADFTILGFIEGIRYTDTAAIVTISERRLGYTKKDGSKVSDELLNFRVIFKAYFKKYLSENFSSGMLVKIKGILLPYAKDHGERDEGGFSLLGQTIDREAYPKGSFRAERKMIKESQFHSFGEPDIDTYQKPDF